LDRGGGVALGRKRIYVKKANGGSVHFPLPEPITDRTCLEYHSQGSADDGEEDGMLYIKPPTVWGGTPQKNRTTFYVGRNGGRDHSKGNSNPRKKGRDQNAQQETELHSTAGVSCGTVKALAY